MSVGVGHEICEENIRELWSALRLIRGALEEVGPVGCLPAEETIITATEEAEAIVRAILKILV